MQHLALVAPNPSAAVLNGSLVLQIQLQAGSSGRSCVACSSPACTYAVPLPAPATCHLAPCHAAQQPLRQSTHPHPPTCRRPRWMTPGSSKAGTPERSALFSTPGKGALNPGTPPSPQSTMWNAAASRLVRTTRTNGRLRITSARPVQQVLSPARPPSPLQISSAAKPGVAKAAAAAGEQPVVSAQWIWGHLVTRVDASCLAGLPCHVLLCTRVHDWLGP